MAKAVSAGILLYRRDAQGELLVFLAHPGGPFWARRDDGAWSIPKGNAEDGDTDLEAVARREFREEVGFEPAGPLTYLGQFRQPSGKLVHAWASADDGRAAFVQSDSFEMEWPPRSGLIRSFPEIDRADWFTVDAAKTKLLKGQVPIVLALVDRLDGTTSRGAAGRSAAALPGPD